MPEKRPMTPGEVAELAAPLNDELMDTGERRIRRMLKDGSGYIYIAAGPKGGWLNSHFHTGVRETIIVQRGWVAEVNIVGGKLEVRVYGPGETFTSQVGVHHTQYVAGNAKTHTVKFGDCSDPKDWHASPELDDLVKHLDESQIFRLAGLSPEEEAVFKKKAFA